MRWSISLLLVLLLVPLPSLAQSPAASDEPEVMPEYRQVVVGRTRPEDPLLSDRSVSVVDRAALDEDAPRSLPEALWDAPGVFVQQTNHGGGAPILRGLIGPQNLILVDGVRLNNSTYRTGPIQYLNLLDPLLLRRVEVLRGPGSVLYGSDAMGGVIQAMPRNTRAGARGPAEGGAAAALGYATANQGRTIHARGEAGARGLSALAAMTYKVLDDLRGGRSIGVQPYSGYEQWSSLARLDYRLPGATLAGWRVSAAHLYSSILGAGRTDKLYDKRSLQLYDNDSHLVYARLHGRLPAINTRGRLTASYQYFFEQKDNITVAEDLRTERATTRDQTTAHTVGLDLALTTRLWRSRIQLHSGGSWYHDMVGAGRQQRQAGAPFAELAEAAYPDGSTYDSFGLYALAEADLWRPLPGHALRLSGGVRLSGMAGWAPEPGPGLPGADFSHLGPVGSASLQYIWKTLATAVFSFSQGFRAPNLAEAVMVGDTGKFFHIPNPELTPERADTLELSLRGRPGPVTASLTGYVSWIHDLIVRVPFDPARHGHTGWQGGTEQGGKAVWLNENGGDALLWGSEASLEVRLPLGLSAGGSVTWTWGEETKADGSTQPMTRIPPLFGTARLRYQSRPHPAFSFYLETFVRGAAAQPRLSAEDEADARIPAGGTDGWWTWNARAGVHWRGGLRLSLTLENLLDEDYKYHGSGVHGAGTNARLLLEGTL